MALASAWNGPNTPPYTATPPYTPSFALLEVFFDGAGNFSNTGYKPLKARQRRSRFLV